MIRLIIHLRSISLDIFYRNILLLILPITFITCTEDPLMLECKNEAKVFSNDDLYSLIEYVERQYSYLIRGIPSYAFYPRSIDNNGNVRFVEGLEWTAGFFPGCLWYLFEMTGDPHWKNEAFQRTLPLKLLSFNRSTHDLGFILNNSFGKAINHSKDTILEWTLINAANSLITRYNDKVGCIKSFDSDSYSFPVIIDNMMNLEILFEATKLSGDTSYKHIAQNHARTTLNHFVRENHSVYQIVDFDPFTGGVIQYDNRQGYDVNSSWSRGQSWAIYGFIVAYRETGDTVFREAAINIFNYVRSQLNENLIPYWDYNAPGIPNEPYDVSALTVLTAALMELIFIEPQYEDQYVYFVNDVLNCLNNEVFLSDPARGQYFILSYSTGNKPANVEVNVPIIYADYYFLETLAKFKSRYID